MEFREFKDLVKQIPIGKQLPDAVYLHESALEVLPRSLGAHLARAVIDLELEEKDWNIVKFFKRDHKITLLDYPTFFEDAYPALHRSYTIDLESMAFREADYSTSDNPPILHRKETFLKAEHEAAPQFREITVEGEKADLYENTRLIGFKQSWERLISRKGYALDKNGRLQPKCNGTPVAFSSIHGEVSVERHLTAIDRNKLSAPMQALARHNYFDGGFSILDFGCGKGDDVRELEAHGLDISGWDPMYRPDGKKRNADIVNLGYVINVIEERSERDKVLCEAFNHSGKILSVSAMVAGEATISQFRPYKDGVVTSRNTFQKYFSQSELRSYIERTLNENAIAVGQGIFLVFKDKDEEQIFLSERQRIRRSWSHLTQRERRTPVPIPSKDLLEKHKQLFDDFWKTCLDLGRIPANSEFEFSNQIRYITGSHKKAFDALSDAYGSDDFKHSQEARRGDLLVYFALGLFGRRKPYSHMPESLKRDVKALFCTYPRASDEAKELLFSVGNPENIEKGCSQAFKRLGCGVFEEGRSFTFHSSLIDELPPTLRIYIGCATQLYGDINEIDLIKIHISSGKVTLMVYDNFDEKPVPELTQRIKIKLRQQEIDIFDYSGEFEPQPLFLKSRFIDSTFPNYFAQTEFDNKLSSLNILDFSGYGPTQREFNQALEGAKYEINGFKLES